MGAEPKDKLIQNPANQSKNLTSNIAKIFFLPKWFLNVLVWLPVIYIALHILCPYVHVSERNILANQVNVLLPSLSQEDKSGLAKVVELQNRKAVPEPTFWEPKSVYDSLLGKRQTDLATNNILKGAIAELKADLIGSTLNEIDLQETNLSRANLTGAQLRMHIGPIFKMPYSKEPKLILLLTSPANKLSPRLLTGIPVCPATFT